MVKLTFSGHDTFHCRQFWLKKAYDYIQAKKSFNDDEASLSLGVGKNMVTAIRYWAKSFQIIDDNDSLTEVAHNLLSDNGWDPYLEDEGSLWLLHYLLVSKQDGADGYSIIFNELIKQKPEFNSSTFVNYVHQNKDSSINVNTLEKDFTAFYRTYYAQFDKKKEIEESFTGILTELNLLKQVSKSVIDANGKIGSKNIWVIDGNIRSSIPIEIFLFVILDQHSNARSIGFEQLYNEPNSPGCVFALSKEGLSLALERLSLKYAGTITYSNEGGIRELQFKKTIEKDELLATYYGQ